MFKNRPSEFIHHGFLLAVFVAWAFVVFGTPSVAHADSFDWRNVDGHSYVTSVKSQGGAGTCAAFGSTAALEAKYMITRNDYSYTVRLSEQHLICDGLIDVTHGGGEYRCLDYFTSTGIVSERELFYTGANTSTRWPLQDGWENRVWKSTSNSNWLPSDTADIKASLKIYGPLTVALNASEDMDTTVLGASGIDHAVLVVGYADDESYAGGGYWIIKNSWGYGWSDNGYGKVMYGNIERHHRVHAIDGAVYYTGAMGTATWGGGSGAWVLGGTDNWTFAGNSAAVWQRETLAVFNAAGSTVAIDGTVIVHGLEFNAGATGYAFSGGSLTVTGGGIVAQESVMINAPVTIGAPQTWSVAAGKTLTIANDVHTVISTLTIDGEGDTYIVGAIDGGGVINSLGAAAGDLVKNGTGVLTLAGANTYASDTTINAGTLILASTGSMLMDINDPGDFYTQFFGDGELVLDGELLLDVTDVTTAGSWELIDDLLTANYGETFSMELIGGGAFEEIGGLLAYTDALDHLWTFSESTGLLTMAAVPEPGTLLLLVAGFVGLLAYRWRR